MSKRAEDAALKICPPMIVKDEDGSLDDLTYMARTWVQKGYEQAEKDFSWISVKDRLPEESGYYITCVAEYYKQEHVPQCVGVTLFNGTYWEDDDDPLKKELVDYWMPIPELPKEEEK